MCMIIYTYIASFFWFFISIDCHQGMACGTQDVDDDGSGTIGYEEFLKMMTHKILNRDPKDPLSGSPGLG